MKRKKIISVILMLTMLIGSVSYAKPSEWAEESIQELWNEGILKEHVFDNFQENITRKDFAYLGVKLYEDLTGRETTIGNAIFEDTNDEYVLKAKNTGFISGVGNNKFEPYREITRDEIAALFVKLYQSMGIQYRTDKTTEKFSDEDEIADWAKEYVNIARLNGIINGVGNNEFAPKQKASREVALIMFNRTLNKFEGILEESTEKEPIEEEPTEIEDAAGRIFLPDNKEIGTQMVTRLMLKLLNEKFKVNVDNDEEMTVGQKFLDLDLVQLGKQGKIIEDGMITKAQMMVMLAVLYDVEDKALKFPLPSTFIDDEGHWAESYIAYAEVQAWTEVVGNGLFKPNAEVDAQMLNAFLLRLLEYYEDNYEEVLTDERAQAIQTIINTMKPIEKLKTSEEEEYNKIKQLAEENKKISTNKNLLDKINLIHKEKRYDDWSKYDTIYLKNEIENAILLKEIHQLIDYAETIKNEEIIKIGNINFYPVVTTEKLKALEIAINSRQNITESHYIKREKFFPSYEQTFYTKEEVKAYEEHLGIMEETIREIEKEIAKIDVINNIIANTDGIDIYITKGNDRVLGSAYDKAIVLKRIQFNKTVIRNIFYHELGHVIDQDIIKWSGSGIKELQEFYRQVLNVNDVRLSKNNNREYVPIYEAFAVDFSLLMNYQYDLKDSSSYDHLLKNLTQEEKEEKYKLLMNYLNH